MADASRDLRADRFHAGVRLAAMLAWFLSIVVVFLLLRALVSALLGPVAGVGVLIIGVAAVFLAQPVAWLAERALLASWPSGKLARLAPGLLEWRERGKTAALDLRQKVNYWRWRFQVQRRRGGRVPTGHHCFAIRLVQGETVLSLYTFLSPSKAEELAEGYAFYELRRTHEQGKQVLGGRDAVYLAAENARWESGAELEPGDFEALLAHLAAHVPEFERQPASGG